MDALRKKPPRHTNAGTVTTRQLWSVRAPSSGAIQAAVETRLTGVGTQLAEIKDLIIGGRNNTP
jgi:hypothetical protein